MSKRIRPTGHDIKKRKSLSKTHIVTPVSRNGIVDSSNLYITPVFLHSSFRTSKTWLWTKLRRVPNAVAYYEIFHEALAGLDPNQASKVSYADWESKHPPSAPYFIEYLPLLQAGHGIPTFDARMAFDTFIPADGLDGHLSVSEKTYIWHLLDNAYAQGKMPILSDSRTLGRVRAIDKAFASKSIFLHRNLFHQWASYSEQAALGNPYFLGTINRILASSRHDLFLRMLDDWFSSRAESPYDERMFQIFLLFHLYLYAHVYDAADLVIDVTALGTDNDYRRFVEDELSQLVCSPIDLSDVQTNFGLSVFNVRTMREFVDTIDRFTTLIIRTCTNERIVPVPVEIGAAGAVN